MATLCHVFGVHRSSYKYWKNRPEKPDGRRAVLRSQVLELHGISHGSAGARIPWLMEASVCRKFCRPVGFRPIRPVALIIPWVMVCPRLYGLPIASTTSPMCGTRRALIGMVGKPPVALILSTARSVRESDPTSNASNTRPSCKATMI
ncbi:hypothetical protein BFQ07_24680 [Escherichia coli]|nr:hypothetical protein BFQ07_24680 [Escherichia coli]